MKKLILILLFPIIANAQLDYSAALQFQNDIRSYYNLNPYSINDDLNQRAQAWADHMAFTDEFDLSSDSLGETIYAIAKNAPVIPNDMFLDATVSWAIDSSDAALNQIICADCSSVGYGISENTQYIYIVAKYDKFWR